MTDILLDTSAYSAYKKNHPLVARTIQHARMVHISVITLGELFSGFARGRHEQSNRVQLQEFLLLPRVRCENVTPDTAERFATIHHYLRQTGRPIPMNDVWIAAVAMEHGLELVTCDNHFRVVPQILLRCIDPATS